MAGLLLALAAAELLEELGGEESRGPDLELLAFFGFGHLFA